MASNSDIIKIGFDYKDSLDKFLKDYDGTMDQVQKSADGKRIEIQFDVADKNVMKKISSLQGDFKNVKIELDGKPLERQLDSIDEIKKILINVVDMVNNGMNLDSLFDFKKINSQVNEFKKTISDNQSSIDDSIQKTIDKYQELKKEIESVQNAYNKIERNKYEEKDPSFIYYKAKSNVDFSGINDDERTYENFALAESKLREIYNLYKQIQTAIDNNNGYFGGSHYDERDLKNLVDDFKAVAQIYQELNPSGFNKEMENISKEIGISYDATTEKVKTLKQITGRMSEDFKGYVSEVIEDSKSVAENNKFFDQEVDRLKEVNKEAEILYNSLKEKLLSRISDNSERSRISEYLPDIFPDIDGYSNMFDFGQGPFGKIDVLNEMAKILGIEIPQAAEKAKNSIKETSNPVNENDFISKQKEIQSELKNTEEQAKKTEQSLKSSTSLPSTETNISFESSSMEQVQKSTDQAVQAKEDFAKANASVQASVDESKSPLQLEAELMEKIAESARKAADAKKEFVEANGKVAASAKESNVSLNSDLTSGHSEISEPTGIKKYQKKGYKAHDTGNHDNEKKVVNKKELGNALKELQSEIIANIDSANSFIKDVTDFYDSNDNLVKTQMKVLDKNGNMSTYTTSYSMDKDGNATAWTSHIDSQKFEDKNQEYQNQLKTIRELSAEKQKLQEQDRKSEVNQALKDQLYAYKQIQSIREKIASTDDENLIAELEKQKQTYQEQYLTATKILKNNSDLYNSESRLNELLQIGLKTTQKISEAEIKRNSAADNKKVKEWDDINAKNQADIWKKNQKAIQNYVNAVKKLQDLLAEDKGTGSKAAAIEKQQGKIKQLEEEALNARAILSSMVNPHTSDASTWDAWVKTMDKLSDASHDAKAAVDDVKKSIQAAQASEIKSMNDGLADYEAKMRSFNNRKPEDRRSDYSTALKNYTDALERYRNELQKIQNHPELINETEINSLKNMRNELDKAATSLKGIEKGSTAISRDKMISKISDYMKKNSAMSKEFKSELEGLIQKLKTLGAEADTTRIADEFFKITQRIREAGQEGKKFWDVVKEKAWYGLAGTIGTYFGFNDLIQYGRQGVQIVRELDTQLTEMMKVSNESAQSLKNYQNTTFDVADTVGTTAKQIQASTADYMRLGESLDEAAESAKTANILLNVSEFSNIEDATKSLVSMGQAYKNLDKLTIVDKLNEVGKLIAQTYSNV